MARDGWEGLEKSEKEEKREKEVCKTVLTSPRNPPPWSRPPKTDEQATNYCNCRT